MKKFIKVFIAGLATLFLTACGGGGGDSTPSITVNVIGTWNYAVTTQNSICDGKLAQGTEIIDSLNGDTTKVGNIIIEGTGFAADSNQNCYVTAISEVTSRASGYQSTGTADDWLNIGYAINAGDNTIDHLSVESFNNNKIQTSTYYKNGVVITSILTR